MPLIDRDAVLHCTDLSALATDICGPPHGTGPGAQWRCPNPAHPDTDASMVIFRGAKGYGRWKCQGCGDGGTAIDLLLVARPGMAVRDALLELGRRAGLDQPVNPSSPTRLDDPVAARTPVPPPPGTAQPAPEPDPAVDDLVSAAARLLWEPSGDEARRYLHARGFTDPLLAANKVGFDPGPRHLERPMGLPRRGPGIVFPALDPATGRAVYYQVRYLAPSAGRRYDQPTVGRASHPRIATLSTLEPAPHPTVVICQGYPDALTAVHIGLSASAVLGAAHTGRTSVDHVARLLLARHPGAGFLICFPNESHAATRAEGRAGDSGADRLADRLAHHQRLVLTIAPPEGTKDLNVWWQTDPDEVRRVLTDTAAHVAPSLTAPAPSASAFRARAAR